jgi:hypothetical protein
LPPLWDAPIGPAGTLSRRRPVPHVRPGDVRPRCSLPPQPLGSRAGRQGVAVAWSGSARGTRRGWQGRTGSWRLLSAAVVRLKDGAPDADGREHPRPSLRSPGRCHRGEPLGWAGDVRPRSTMTTNSHAPRSQAWRARAATPSRCPKPVPRSCVSVHPPNSIGGASVPPPVGSRRFSAWPMACGRRMMPSKRASPCVGARGPWRGRAIV